jgi:6-phosphofructo-2-kinase/fructose-2,6-biphosphatase 2
MFAADPYMQSDDSKICVVMVGLPARGKSLIAGKGKCASICSVRETDS